MKFFRNIRLGFALYFALNGSLIRANQMLKANLAAGHRPQFTLTLLGEISFIEKDFERALAYFSRATAVKELDKNGEIAAFCSEFSQFRVDVLCLDESDSIVRLRLDTEERKISKMKIPITLRRFFYD